MACQRMKRVRAQMIPATDPQMLVPATRRASRVSARLKATPPRMASTIPITGPITPRTIIAPQFTVSARAWNVVMIRRAARTHTTVPRYRPRLLDFSGMRITLPKHARAVAYRQEKKDDESTNSSRSKHAARRGDAERHRIPLCPEERCRESSG